MDASAKRLTKSGVTEFLGALGIPKVAPVGRSSDSGENANETRLQELLQKGDPLSPGPGQVVEDATTLSALLAQAGEMACVGLTPDGHVTDHQLLRFDADQAAQQMIQVLAVDMADEDKDEALAAIWLALAYHDHDHPADFGGLLRSARRGGVPRCCYVDVKGTRAQSPSAQRTKLEQRAQERKFGCLAQTVTAAANHGFEGYPGHGQPGLMVTLLYNPVMGTKNHVGFVLGWFFGISSNYQATAAVWGWGGSQGVKLPAELMAQLEATQTTIRGQTRNLLELLREFQDYSQYRDAQGEWDLPSLSSTLYAMFLAARYLLMYEDEVQHAETTVRNLQPARVETPLSPEDFHPGESFATYFGRQADANKRLADENARKADENARKADDAILRLRQREEDLRKKDEEMRRKDEEMRKKDEEMRRKDEEMRKKDEEMRKAEDERRKAADERRKAEDERRKAEANIRGIVVRRRQRGHTDVEIAEDLGCTVEELLQRFPQQP